MKKIRILCLAMAMLLLIPCVTACGDKVLSTVTVKFQEPTGEVDENGEDKYENLFEYKLTIEGTTEKLPNVLQAAEEALNKFEQDYELSKDGTYIASAFNHKESDSADAETGYFSFWEVTINGEKSDAGRQSVTAVYDNDVIVFTWTSDEKPRQDTDAVVTTDPNEDTTVPEDTSDKAEDSEEEFD